MNILEKYAILPGLHFFEVQADVAKIYLEFTSQHKDAYFVNYEFPTSKKTFLELCNSNDVIVKSLEENHFNIHHNGKQVNNSIERSVYNFLLN